MKKLTTQEFINKAMLIHDDCYDYSLVKYDGNLNNVEIVCKIHGIFNQLPSNHLRGAGCKYCADNVKKDINHLNELAKKYGGKCHSKKYLNAHTKYEWECEVGHKWISSATKLVSGRWCPECSKIKMRNTFQRKDGLEFLQKLANDRNGKCLSTEYFSICHKYKWQCEAGHIWEGFGNGVQRGSWCPKCATRWNSKGIKIIENYLINNNINYEREVSFQECKHINKLRFDFYLKERNVCIEFDHKQHFVPIEFFGKKEGFEKTKIRDNIKTKYCLDNNIKLVRISYLEI